MRNRNFLALILVAAMALSIQSCADSRLVEEPETDEQQPEPHPLAHVEHLHEDGNWYAGWAIPLSQELTAVTTVEEDKLIIPRDEFFDMELAILTPMDIVAGASEEHGFLKRVIEINRDENQWELTVVNAYLPEVFLEGEFEAVNGAAPANGDGLSAPTKTVRQAQGDAFGDKTFKKEEIKESCGRNCKNNTTIEVKGGISASVNPNIEFTTNADGERRVSSRTLFEFANLFPQNKEPGREMCSTISGVMSNFASTNRQLIEASRQGNSSDVEAYSEDLGEYLYDMHVWAMHHAGHSPFPPFIPGSGSTSAKIQRKRVNSSCNTDEFTWFRPEKVLGDFLGCTTDQTDNKFIVNPVAGGPRYTLGTGNTGSVYHAMMPDFRIASYHVTKMLSIKPHLRRNLTSNFPDYLVSGYASEIRDEDDPKIPHRNQQWADSAVRYKQFSGGPRLAVLTRRTAEASAYDRAREVFERKFRNDDDLYNDWRNLENRPLVDDPFNWLSASLAVAKLYCAGVELSSARMGAGADLEFTWEPTFTLDFGGTASTTQTSAKKVKKDLRVAKTTTATLIGPVPLWYSIEGKVRFNAYLKLAGKLQWNVRKHKARADFFLGIEKNGNTYSKLTLGDFPGASSLDRAQDRREGNLFELFGVPNGVSQSAHDNTPLVSLGEFAIEGKAGFEPGIGIELVLYDFLGFGAGLNLTTEASIGYSTVDGISADFLMGPTLEAFTSVKLPICEGDACDEAQRLLQSICNWPPANGLFCGNNSNFCRERPYLCPQISAGDRAAEVRLPLFNSCNWFPWGDTGEPICRAPDNFDIVARALPPCAKACYRSAPKTGNKWIALSYKGTPPTTHRWAGDPDELTGVALDDIFILGDNSEPLYPETVEVDSFTLDNEDQRKIYYCDGTDCTSRDFMQCTKENLNRSVVHFRRSLLVQFPRDLKQGDALFLNQQYFGRTQNADGNVCGQEVEFEVLLGSKSGEGYWNSLGKKSPAETDFSISLSTSDFATPSSHDKKNADIIPNMSVAR